MTVGVIDQLEMIGVDHDERIGDAMIHKVVIRPTTAIHHQTAIGNARQQVMG